MEKHKKPCLSGNVTAASQSTGAVLRGEKKQQLCRDATETSLSSGRFLDKAAQSTAGQRAQYCPELGHSTSSALTAEHPTTPQEMPSAWESIGKDQLRTQLPGTNKQQDLTHECEMQLFTRNGNAN